MKNPFKKFSLQATFFTSFIAISAVLITLLGLTSYYITNREVVDETISSRILLLNEINKQIDYQLQAIENDALVVASNPEVQIYLQNQEQSYERLQQNSELLDLISRYSYIKNAIHSVQLFAKGSTTSSYRGANGIFAYSFIEQSPAYKFIQHADAAWLGAHQLEVGDYLSIEEKVVSYYRKIWSTQGEELGIIAFHMKLSYMNELISASMTVGNRYITDSSMRLIVEVHESDKLSVKFHSVEQQLSKQLDNHNEEESHSHAIIESANSKQLLIWNQQPRTQWMAMDMIPWESITEGSRQIQRTILFAILICIVLAIGFALVLSKQFVNPIKTLVSAMTLLKSGKMASRVKNDYTNEFGYMNQHFNSMAEEIEELIQQLNVQHQKAREAELKVLQEQMNPHFLYNTLDTMNWHAIASGSNDISRMLSLLGKMMRIGLSSGNAIIPIAKEAEHLHCYVELQKIRLQHAIDFHINLPDELFTYYIPKITLQPIVENAIIHGLHSRRKGYIEVKGWLADNNIKLEIKDNGYGIPKKKDIYSSEHHGLKNIKERIEMYYGPQYGLLIESEEDKGTTVLITLPRIVEEQKKEV